MRNLYNYHASNSSSDRFWSGLFISFEGGDGVGKSTHLKRLYERLRLENLDVVLTREPGGSEGAEEIRQLLVAGEPGRWSSMTEALLMVAARNDHLEKTILPALHEGKIVLCDRFADSTMAYQGIAGALGEERIRELHKLVIGDIAPDITFLLTLTSDAGLARAKAREEGNSQADKSASAASGEDRFERKGKVFQDDVHGAFSQIAKKNPDRCISIDTSGNIEQTSEKIFSILQKKFSVDCFNARPGS